MYYSSPLDLRKVIILSYMSRACTIYRPEAANVFYDITVRILSEIDDRIIYEIDSSYVRTDEEIRRDFG